MIYRLLILLFLSSNSFAGGLQGIMFQYLSSSPIVTHRTSFHSSTSTTSYSFSNRTIGTPSDDRLVVISITVLGGSSLSTVTIGGVAATSTPDSWGQAGIWYANIPTGTTTDVAITTSGSPDSVNVVLWTITNHNSETPFDTGSSGADPCTSTSTTLNVPADGVAICGGRHIGNDSATWTGLDENVDTIFSSNRGYIGASKTFTSATSLTATVTYTGSESYCQMICASWR